jgi:5'-nucleotidase
MEKRTDPRQRTYYWQGADMQTFGEDLDVDGAALRHGFISITPITCDMTDYKVLDALKQWGLDARLE